MDVKVELREPSDADEVLSALDVIGADFTLPFDHTDPRMQRILAEPTRENPLFVIATTAAGEICGAAFALRSGSDGALLATIGVVAAHRGTGLGRRLMEHIEATCTEENITGIVLGAVPEARPFYRHLGYTGKSAMHKSLPGSAAARYGDDDERRRRLDDLRTRRAARTSTVPTPTSHEGPKAPEGPVSYAINPNGTTHLIKGEAAFLGALSQPVDLAQTANSHYLYLLLRGSGAVAAFKVSTDGSLHRLGVTTGGLPVADGASGLAAY